MSIPAGGLVFASWLVTPGFMLGSYGILEHRVVSPQSVDVVFILENGLDDFEELIRIWTLRPKGLQDYALSLLANFCFAAPTGVKLYRLPAVIDGGPDPRRRCRHYVDDHPTTVTVQLLTV